MGFQHTRVCARPSLLPYYSSTHVPDRVSKSTLLTFVVIAAVEVMFLSFPRLPDDAFNAEMIGLTDER
jgi:hypothetical protein